jgi:hypothetical protein
MAKFGQLLLQKGKWNGKQIVPESWVEEATSFQIMSNNPSNKTPTELNDWKQGYGYQFWRCRNNAFRADGLGGQFIIVLPEKNAVVVLTSSATDTQEELNLVWDNLLPAMQEKPLTEDSKASAELAERIASLSTLKTSSSTPATLQTKISGRKIDVAHNELGMQGLRITFTNKDSRIQIEYGIGKYEFTAGLDHWKLSQTKLRTLAAAPDPEQNIPIQIASKYSWSDESTLELAIKFVEESSRSEVCIIRFEETELEIKVPIEMKNYIEFSGINSRMLEGRMVN